jgi:hypothetical protein
MMKILSAIFVLLLSKTAIVAQDRIYNLSAAGDSFHVTPGPFSRVIKANDTAGFGTGLYNQDFIVKTDIDSVTIHFDPSKKPFRQNSWIRISSPAKVQWVVVNYQEMSAEFTPDYIRTNTGNVQFDVPEAYELANILYALTQDSRINSVRTYKESGYYKDVMAYFKPYADHPLVKQLEFGEKGAKDYYNFRENSFCFRFQDDEVVRNNQYYTVQGNITENLFEKLLPLINDFVKKSGFRKFYATQKKYYESQIARERMTVPVPKMWKWLEDNFSRRFQSYRIVFSPLIKGSHSTQQFWWAEGPGKFFTETVMFVSGPVVFEKDSRLTEKQEEAIASGVVFTEIDHNYVNPVSSKYRKKIDSVFSDREKWLLKDGDALLYQSAEAIFNEYMTHAAFILYAFDNFSPEDFQLTKKTREDIMIRQRKYVRFKEFSDELLRLYTNRAKGRKLEDLYGDILKWAVE